MTGEAGARPSVGVAVLTWRGYEVTRACLESLRLTSGWPFPLVVIDNDSGTGEGERLAAEFGPPVEALTLPANGGIPGGYNAGLAWASRRGLQFVLLLNNDTIASDGRFLEGLLGAVGDRVGAVGPIVRTGTGEVWSAGGALSWGTGRARHLHQPRSSAPYEADWLDGSCLLVRVGAARSIGGFEPDFFMYWEELDWCIRARAAGFRCVVEPRASITHIGSVSVTTPQKMHFWLRNRLLFMRRNASLGANAATLAAYFLRTVPYLAVSQGLSPRGWALVLRSASGALAWNVGDAVRRRSWRRAPDGPAIDLR